MVESIRKLLENNEHWVNEMIAEDPEYFSRRNDNQTPSFLWIGCSDNKFQPNEVTGTDAGELVVHRNIANLVVQADMNVLSVIGYAVEILKVRHVIICGHYGCNGVRTAMQTSDHGFLDNWLRAVRELQGYYWNDLKMLKGEERENKLVELNVREQVYNLGKTSIIQNAWKKSNHPYLHGWVHDPNTGRILSQTGMIHSDMSLKEVCKFETGTI